MTKITPAAHVLKDCTMRVYDTIAGSTFDDYAPAASTVQLTPSSSTQTFVGMSLGATFSDTTPATWVLDLTYAQDWESTKSLSQLLFDREGEDVKVDFIPKNGTSVKGFSVIVSLVPGAIGGAGAQFATASVSLGVKGKPAKITA